MVIKHARKLVVGILGSVLIGLAGCGGPAQPSNPPSELATVTVHLAASDPLSTLPVLIAKNLALFKQEHLHVIWTQERANITVGMAGNEWPIRGIVAQHPDLVLLSPVPDPHFRLRALNHLAMIYSPQTTFQLTMARYIFARHRVQISSWTAVPFSKLETLWKQRHLPWALVTLSQSLRLKRLDAGTTVLSWLGASTGSVPTAVITATHEGPLLPRFLAAVNLALWYLHTTPSAQIGALFPHNKLFGAAIKQALQYQYWPTTTYLDQTVYDRGRAEWSGAWPHYSAGVSTHDARQALKESGP